MPAVLIECGFISNAEDLKVLSSEEGQKAIAGRITAAFVKFKHSYDSSVRIDSDSAQPAENPVTANNAQASNIDESQYSTMKPTTASQSSDALSNTASLTDGQSSAKAQEEASVKFGVQVFTLSRVLPNGDSRLLGYEPTVITAGNSYKYIIGTSESRTEAESRLAEIRKKYPDSYLVKIENGSASRLK